MSFSRKLDVIEIGAGYPLSFIIILTKNWSEQIGIEE